MSPVVDVHAHTLVPDAQRLVARRARTGDRAVDAALLTGTWWHALVDLDERLAVMDAAGVDVQVVGVAPWQYHYGADRALAGELVVAVNDGIAGLVRRAPDRLVGVGTVALQHPDLAADQLRRAVDDHDFRGVQISTSAGGRELSDPAYDPFWSIAELLGVVVFVHPRGSAPGVRVAELTAALSHLVLGGVLDRFPCLAVCGAHGGGNVLRALERTDRRLYVDSVVDHDAALRRLVDVAGPDRVLLGSDYPFGTGADATAALDALSPDERSAVRGGNATGLLRLTTP